MIGAVSPAARAMPRIVEVKMPGVAKGSTLRQIVCQRVAPRAMLVSRKPCGTACRHCSLAVMITGRMTKASVKPPESTQVSQP